MRKKFSFGVAYSLPYKNNLNKSGCTFLKNYLKWDFFLSRMECLRQFRFMHEYQWHLNWSYKLLAWYPSLSEDIKFIQTIRKNLIFSIIPPVFNSFCVAMRVSQATTRRQLFIILLIKATVDTSESLRPWFRGSFKLRQALVQLTLMMAN